MACDVGLYCSGWAKTTPIGVLLTTMAFETADAIVKDFKEGRTVHSKVLVHCLVSQSPIPWHVGKLLAPSENGDVLNLLKNLPGRSLNPPLCISHQSYIIIIRCGACHFL